MECDLQYIHTQTKVGGNMFWESVQNVVKSMHADDREEGKQETGLGTWQGHEHTEINRMLSEVGQRALD